MICFHLFFAFFQIGLFSFGGGYAAIPLIEEQIVGSLGWLSAETFSDLISIAEMTPGPISVNAASFVGMQTAGFTGALAATAGCIAPSCILSLLLACMYQRFRRLRAVDGIISCLKPAVTAMIASTWLTLTVSVVWVSGNEMLPWANLNWSGIFIFAAALIVILKTKLSPVLILILSGVAGIAVYGIGECIR